MTEKRKRHLALQKYLSDTCPQTRQQINEMIWAGNCRVSWNRGIVKLHVTDPAHKDLLQYLVDHGRDVIVRKADFTLGNNIRIPKLKL